MKFMTQFRRSSGSLFIQATLACGILLFSFSPHSLLANVSCSGWNEEGYFNDLSIVELVDCVHRGVNLEARNSNGLAPLQSVLKLRDGEFVRVAVAVFLIAGADPNAANSSQESPLILSMDHVDADIAKLLLQAGADPNFAGPRGRTALHVAYGTDHVAALLAHGANPSAVDEDGRTVLHAAVAQTEGDAIVTMLLEHGADFQIPDSEGISPLDVAVFYEDQAQVEALIEIGANPDAAGPLPIAAQYNKDTAILQSLLSAGAKLQTKGSLSSLVAAISENRNPEIGSVLLQAHHEAIAGEQSIFWKPGLRQVKCWFNQYEFAGDIECFYMVVYENPYEHPYEYVSFPVLRFFDQNLSTLNSPLIYLGGGGPGGETEVGHLPYDYRTLWEELARPIDRELYVIDIRGTGIAHPKLSCDLDLFRRTFEDAEILEPIDELYSDYENCKVRLDKLGIDLSQYNSRVVARDVDLLRHELGIEKWVLVGYSYSARYAVTVARDFPHSVESMVLVAPGGLPGENIIPENLPKNYQNAFEKVFARCKNEINSCTSDDLGERFQSLVERLNKDPLIITSISEELSYEFGIDHLVLTGYQLVEWLFSNLYDTEFFDKFPGLVSELERLVNNSEEHVTNNLLNSIRTYLYAYIDPYYSDPVYYAHYCSEQRPFMIYSEWMRIEDDTPEYIRHYFESYTETDFVRECEIWDVAPSDEKENEYVKTNIPTLFLVGALDPVAPIEKLNDQLPYFSKREVLVFENSSHWGGVFENCAKDAAAYFIANKHLEDRHFDRCTSEF